MKKLTMNHKLLLGIIILIIAYTFNDTSYFKPIFIITGCWIIVFNLMTRLDKYFEEDE